MKKNLSSNRYAVFLPIFYPIGCYSSVFTFIFPIVFCSSRTRHSSRCAFSLYSWRTLISLRNRLFSSWRSWRSLARSVARLSAFAFASVAWTISSGAGIFRNRTRNKAVKRSNNRETVYPKFRKSTRHRSGRSSWKKNSTSPGKEAGALEWVCNFRTESMDFVQLWVKMNFLRKFVLRKKKARRNS